MPSHGTETCTVVEAMLSYNVIFETFGDALFAERAERIAYNALPGAMTKDVRLTRTTLRPPAPATVTLTTLKRNSTRVPRP